MPPHIVIIGGGFGGLSAAKTLRRAPVAITLIDRRNFHLFQPLLYQVATGGLSPANIASPLREVLKRQRNTRVLLGEAVGIDAGGRAVRLRNGEAITYDTLIVATGASHNYFGHPEWAAFAPGLKTVEDATEMRRRILLAFEAAERESDPKRRAAWLTFVVVGAGPTGVELAGALTEIARDTLRGSFRSINPADAQILLIEGADRVLPPYNAHLAERAAEALAHLGVRVIAKSMVVDIQPGSVTLKTQTGPSVIAAHTVLWAAGVQASPLGQMLAQSTGCALDRVGRPIVQPDLTVPHHPEIFVIGDLAHVVVEGKPLPGLAPVAMSQGRYVAQQLLRRLRGEAPAAFRYREKGSMATIGRGHAIAQVGRLRLWGWPAWLAWLFVHLMGLVTFENRLLVLLQWAWNYTTFNRSARLITGEAAPQ
jgi:NADH dehydrogenase